MSKWNILWYIIHVYVTYVYIYIYTYMYMYIYVDVDINIDIYTIYIHYITLHCITCTFTFHLHLHFPLQYYSTVHILHTYITYAYTYLCTYITITITTTIAITIPFHSIQYKTPPYNTIPYYTIQYMHNQSVSSQKKVHHNSSQSPTKDRDSTAGHTAFLGHRPACVQPTHPCVLVPPAMTGHRHKVVMTWMIWGGTPMRKPPYYTRSWDNNSDNPPSLEKHVYLDMWLVSQRHTAVEISSQLPDA